MAPVSCKRSFYDCCLLKDLTEAAVMYDEYNWGATKMLFCSNKPLEIAPIKYFMHF